ncbi:hypothetical protein [secondary endosymbiont of Ctenarytaina eucalypti]|uniref:Uncharacterized protein n=1 Tax=secondary endosymbiont of Ctenarytaina eucalypti TaxID=1199245 RepID=J3Z4P7_9ENTR|nr:hypothetical protein [secondary endosymbiont of Ctenarytaina eucalypti]AFP85274.1 hypothetical protein A359_09080 [secondary endosymbiont of Ctenarytaina eucalypti]
MGLDTTLLALAKQGIMAEAWVHISDGLGRPQRVSISYFLYSGIAPIVYLESSLASLT